jgi:NADH dehydrogenase
MAAGLVTVFGGSGFIGRYVVQRLAQQGWTVRVAVRRPERCLFLKTMGVVGQVTPIAADLRSERAVAAAVDGADAVINLVGILYEKGGRTFQAIHAEGAERAARLAKAAGARTFVQMSALGAAADAPAEYARSKAAGEAAVRRHFPDARIVRPSIVFGPEDGFFNKFAAMARFAPALPLVGGGGMKFQPVYVGDVAEALLRCVENPYTAGKTYELGGPGVFTFAELLRRMLREIGRRRLLLPLPFGIARIQAAFMEWLPVPPLTRDQLKLLERDNVVSPGALTLADLDIQAQGLDAVLPTYLARYRPGGRVGRRASAL